MKKGSFIEELSRRNVFRVGVAYLAGAWLLIQVADTVLPRLGFTDTAVTNVIVLLAIGFLPALILAWIFQLTPEGIRRDAGAPAEPAGARHKTLDRAIIVTLVLALGYFAVDKFVLDPTRDAEKIQTAREEGRADAVVESYGDKSIVVLPFVNMSADPGQEYFSDGISEELLNLLAQIPELRVISRSTAFTFKGKDIVISEVAKKLNVAHILEGSVRRSGNKVRITAQLIDARTDTHLWSDTYDRELDDIFSIQDEISAKVVADLKLKLLGSGPRAEEIDPRAYELFLRGRHLLHTGDSGAAEFEAASLLEKAVELQPDWVSANAELIRAYFRLYYSRPDQQAHYERLAWARLDELFKIDKAGNRAYGWLGWLTWQWRDDLQLAATYIERATSLDPYAIDNMRGLGALLIELNRYDEATAVAEYVVERDPGCSSCVTQLANCLRATGRHREAAARLEAILDWHPANDALLWPLGVAWLVAGEPEKALDTFDKLDNGESGGLRQLGRLLALHDLGRLAEFESGFAGLRESGNPGPESIARIYAWTGDNDQAFFWLDRMVETEGPASAARVKTDLYSKLKPDPRWQAFLEKYGKTDEDVSRIVFKPVYPPEIEASLTGSGLRR
ncbi:MAG TPA: tetratricopeptide repeat protein [Woeseiaceae bacterium]|nr:tetratricopeptide repeat protein [Woeseiaceae bacterium]